MSSLADYQRPAAFICIMLIMTVRCHRFWIVALAGPFKAFMYVIDSKNRVHWTLLQRLKNMNCFVMSSALAINSNRMGSSAHAHRLHGQYKPEGSPGLRYHDADGQLTGWVRSRRPYII
eukprot:scaffold62517_cov19-Prasinocladus_malaysianus.AAC.3